VTARPPSAEDDFVARLIRPLAGEGAFDLKDDAARLVPPPDHELVLTADAIVLGIHAFAEDPPDLVARKALRVNHGLMVPSVFHRQRRLVGNGDG